MYFLIQPDVPDFPPFDTPYVTAEVDGRATRFRCNFNPTYQNVATMFEVNWYRSSDDALIKEKSEVLLKSDIMYFGNDVSLYWIMCYVFSFTIQATAT